MTSESQRQYAKSRAKKFALYYTLIFAPICLAIMFWPMGDHVTTHGYIAHYIAVALAFLSGLICMAVFFFSSHSGGDEQPNYVEMAKRQKDSEADL